MLREATLLPVSLGLWLCRDGSQPGRKEVQLAAHLGTWAEAISASGTWVGKTVKSLDLLFPPFSWFSFLLSAKPLWERI